jgi:hypothetical protein
MNRFPQNLRVIDPNGTRLEGQAGFGIVELVLATFVLALAMTGFAVVLASAARSNVASGERTRAQQLATSEVEAARAIAYDQLGTVGGNPPGTLPQTKTVNDLQVKTRVSFADDRVPGSFQTYRDYKVIKVTVNDPGTAKTLASFETKVAPPGAPGINEATIKTKVVDYALNTPIPNATVSLTGTGSPRSDDTDAAGDVIFAGLSPNSGSASHYDLTASAPGYVTVADDLPPAAQTHTQVAPTSVFTTAIRMFKPVTVAAQLVDNTGQPFNAATTVTFDSANMNGTAPTSSGSLSTTTLGGKPILPNVDYTLGAYSPINSTRAWFATSVTQRVPPDYPSSLTSSFALTMNQYDIGRIQVHVKNASNQPVMDATVKVQGGPADVAYSGVTNSGGTVTFTVPREDVNGVYEVTVLAQGGGSQVQQNSRAQGSTTVVTLTLP